jgi:hypothetical protein
MDILSIFPAEIWHILIDYMNLDTILTLRRVSKSLKDLASKQRQIYIYYGSKYFIIDCKANVLLDIKHKYKQTDWDQDYCGELYDTISAQNRIIIYDQPPPYVQYPAHNYRHPNSKSDKNSYAYDTEVIVLERARVVYTTDKKIIYTFKSKNHICTFYCKSIKSNHYSYIVYNWNYY